ncbi:MAG: Plug domain-containing protein, partial [Vicinamibacterales bacterium]
MFTVGLSACIGWLPVVANAQPAQSDQPPTFVDHVDVIAAAPLPGLELTLDQLPSPVQVATDKDIDASGALDVADFLNKRVTGVHINEVQGNPFQPDVNYRGYTASPLLGTPQGLSVYMDGVRMNQPFGDVVSWDLIPRMAIASSTLMPGSNPLFGLNTLGGALALQTKDGQGHKGTTVQGLYGSHVRRALEFEHGGARSSGVLNWYFAGNFFGDDGWRTDSPSDVRQVFG